MSREVLLCNTKQTAPGDQRLQSLFFDPRCGLLFLFQVSCQNIFSAISVSQIHSGQKPMNRITLSVSDDVPVAT